MRRNLKHRTVIEIKKDTYISQEPEMKKLIETSKGMTGEEKTRTKQYLKGQEVITPFRVNSTKEA